MRPSTTKLSKMLVDFGVATDIFDARAVKEDADPIAKGFVPMAEDFGLSNETYGQNSCLYIHCPGLDSRHQLERFLEREGVTTVNCGYAPETNTVEVGVTYFQGWHWDV